MLHTKQDLLSEASEFQVAAVTRVIKLVSKKTLGARLMFFSCRVGHKFSKHMAPNNGDKRSTRETKVKHRLDGFGSCAESGETQTSTMQAR